MNPIAEDILMHYGIARRSGRYPWGSGEDPYQHGSGDFLGRIELLKKSGWEETPENIMKEFGLTTTEYRNEKAICRNERRSLEVAAAKSLKDDGLGPTEIARELSERYGRHINESTIRSYLNEESETRMNQAKNTADFIKQQIESKGMIDVGAGVERELGISREKLNQALKMLEEEGYPVYKGGIPQVTNKGQQTNQIVICPPGTEHKDIYNFENVHSLNDYTSVDGGQTFRKFEYPASMDSKRLMIRYKDDVGPDGAKGIEKDGVIEIRRGVEDLSLGNSHYAQVRILVDGTHYLKGMAVYSDDLPKGIDVVFNTNKSKDKGMKEVLKEIKNDPDNPFGSLIKANGQSYYDDPKGKYIDPITGKRQSLSLINKRAEEGDWTEWKDKLPSQFLSKQSVSMAKKQLELAIADKNAEFDEIKSLTNPTVKKHFLNKFADECDSAAVHLQAAALPGQKYHVIIPVNSLKDNEVYAPNYTNGTKLALIRYPHGGTFEIPICTVNNKHSGAKKLLGTDIIDAIGINSKVAERLSGADFDGDTVMCIPTHDKKGKVKITSTPPLKGLEGFDSKSYQYDKKEKDDLGVEHYYKNGKEFKVMKNTQTEMGKISNLITDMTLKGAKPSELAAAVRHSMVVIDAEKHKLDYKQSALDNNISALIKKYQIKINDDGKVTYGGASTLISKSKGEVTVDKRQGTPKVNIKGTDTYDPSKPEGSLIYKTADNLEYQVLKTNKRTGETTVVTKKRTQASTNMAETTDARTLISDANTPMERVYADYANTMKNLANEARITSVNTGKLAYSPSAKKAYSQEVKSLADKLDTAMVNAPREREAQRRSNAEMSRKINENPSMKNEDIKKASQQALTRYREEVNSVSRRNRSIEITDKEWAAIQAGAISENKLIQILNNADADKLRERATPRTTTTLSTAKINKIKAMNNSNYTLKEIADALGVSTTIVNKYLKGEN